MKSLSRHHPLLLLFLSTLVHFSHFFTQAASTSPSVTRSRIIILTAKGPNDDYDDDDDYDIPYKRTSVRTPFVNQEPSHLCKHNPCLEDQPSCAVLSQQTACLCPGLSGASEPPHAPWIHSLLPVKEGPDRGKIEIQWCAPSSVVSGYRVIIEGGTEQPQEFNDSKRRGLVGYLEVGTKVCVEAVNRAGHSSRSEFSCKRYEAPTSSDHRLMVGILAGAVLLFLLLIIGVVIICKCRPCKKKKRDADDGLGNPSYSVGGTL
ncbi:leucine-rich repeat neuronal protein 4 [Periophthalmus magnuspinnatus]|uniref:leucine-rich repeat neuronal protein 4 n=1 Tax=Periophthalmus magnuspinnatus TaxID=409849 RepID=UPI00145B4427|nr:leucine-rich repeat neuronal protein 4 [Periophthalmus magnuspinnatus]